LIWYPERMGVFLKPEVDSCSDNLAELDLPAFGENAEFDVGVVGNCDLVPAC
jgi:hypothetical protein